jgi:hypothetical protein
MDGKATAAPAAPALTCLWVLLLALIFLLPAPPNLPIAGDDLVRNTVRLALFYYAIAVNLMLWLRPGDWMAASRRGRLARLCWTLAWAAYLIHLAMAFHHYHSWSHSHAMEHTRDVSGVGEGIFVSHFFTLLWTADVLWWWQRPEGYAQRSPWIGRVLHGFMLFVIFNGTVVYETGPIRWAGVVLFAELAAVGLYRRPAAGNPRDHVR